MTDAPEPAEETDDDAEGARLELKAAELPPQRRVVLAYGDQTVEIVAPDSLEMIAELAAGLWRLTTPTQQNRMGFTAGNTVYLERAPSDLGEQDATGGPA